jgi:GT2 family glycosyltransferase
VAVVILTWNALAFTKQCLAALRENTDHPAWRVIVVDNGSADGTVEWLATQSWLTVIRNGRNLGFSRGCNIGMAATGPDEDVVLMNNDVVVVDPTWLTRSQEVAYSADDVAVVGTRIVDGNGVVIHTGAFMQPITMRGQQMAGAELNVNQCSRDREVESVVFAQAYVRRDCIDRIGVLDERLFAYFEDSDYCLRASRAGLKVLCAGSFRPPVHFQSTSTKENRVEFWSVYNRSQKVFRAEWGRWLEEERYAGELVWHSVLHQPMGYAVQSRRIMTALHFAGLKVAYRNAYGLDEDPPEHLLLADLVKRRPRADVPQVALCQADAFGRVTGGPRVGWSMLEVTGLPPDWVAGCNAMDEVWVPATFNVETFRHSGVRVPIRVMPFGVDVDDLNPEITGYRPSSRFTFLSVFEWGERKAPEILLRAYTDEFDESDDVVLLLSVFNRDPTIDVRAEIAKLELPPGPPLVVMVNAGFPDHQMGALYRSADCFVLPTRGEGFGMPVLEAMACGLPTIATAWSGPADFLTEEVGYPLEPERLVAAEARCPYYAGFEWAQPSYEHLRHLMREVYERPAEAKKRGLAAAAEVAANWTWERAAARVRDRVLELG